ncbi:MAG TPA: dihydrofolate reductase family protein [Steroidobacteraceae bacterium]|nr:dihydrofolate reductase family protein [Steroidobacteraceae bacterium]
MRPKIADQGLPRVRRVLVEGGPRLLADFFKQRLVSEQFLTLAPQIAGRVEGHGRLGMVMGKVFAPRDPLWGKLTDVRQGASHLFLRYSFA